MVPFKCNVHAWMNAYVGVLEHPLLRGDRRERPLLDSATASRDVHDRDLARTLGTQTQQVTVAPKDTKDSAFTYKVS